MGRCGSPRPSAAASREEGRGLSTQGYAPRWIDLEGAANVRDLGGLPTVDGRATRQGVVLRSDNLQGLTPGDVDRLLELGVRSVVDLRTPGERRLEGPGPLREQGVITHHDLSLVPTQYDRPDELDVEQVIPARPTRRSDDPTDMTGYYVGYVEDMPENVAAALRVLADGASGTTVVHCAAGKDRTGVVVALALSLAGVHRDLVVADYVASADRVAAVLARLQASPTYADELAHATPDHVRPVAGSMERFLDEVDRRWGGPHALALSIGLTEEDVSRLCTRLVGASPHARADRA